LYVGGEVVRDCLYYGGYGDVLEEVGEGVAEELMSVAVEVQVVGVDAGGEGLADAVAHAECAGAVEEVDMEGQGAGCLVADGVDDLGGLHAVVADEVVGAGNGREEDNVPGRIGEGLCEIEEELAAAELEAAGVEEGRDDVEGCVAVELFGEDAEAPGQGGMKDGVGRERNAGVLFRGVFAAGDGGLSGVALFSKTKGGAKVLADGGEGLVVAELEDEDVGGLLAEAAEHDGGVADVDGGDGGGLGSRKGTEADAGEAEIFSDGPAVGMAAAGEDDVGMRIAAR
jgi:hypothetical protein